VTEERLLVEQVRLRVDKERLFGEREPTCLERTALLDARKRRPDDKMRLR
jgi:hypothetical protein